MGALAGRFLRDESGATAIEYSVMASGIALAIVTAVSTLGNNTVALYNRVVAVMP